MAPQLGPVGCFPLALQDLQVALLAVQSLAALLLELALPETLCKVGQYSCWLQLQLQAEHRHQLV